MSNTKLDSLNERLRALITLKINEHRRFKELEEKTGIASATWKSYWTTGTRPSYALIEAAAKQWKSHAFWLITGIDDSPFGHQAPEKIGFPSKSVAQQSSADYFDAIGAYSQEADHYVTSYWDDAAPLISEELRDFTKRNVTALKGSETSSPSKAAISVSVLKEIRWVEVLIDTVLPRFGYEDTARMLEVAKSILAKAEAMAESEEIKCNTAHIHLKIKEVEGGIAKWNLWKEENPNPAEDAKPNDH